MIADRGAGVWPTAQRRMTAREYYALPEGPPYSQLLNSIGTAIFAPADVELDEDNVFQPDLYFIRNERLGIVEEHGVKGAPDLVIEVISRSTARHDLGHKKAICAAKGGEELWAVFPLTRKVWRFPRRLQRWSSGKTRC